MRRSRPPSSERKEPERRAALQGEGGTAAPRLVRLGEFGRAQGLRGEVRLKSFTADPLAIGAYGPLATEDGRVVTIAAARPAGSQPDLLVVRIEGIATREAAEALNGVGLFVARERLGEPEEDEFFLADLVGLQATLADGTVAGTVVDVQNYGSGDLLEIAPPGGGQSVLLPFTKAFVPQIDIGGGRVVIDSDEFATPSDDAGVREARG